MRGGATGWTLPVAALMALGIVPPVSAQRPSPKSPPASSKTQSSASKSQGTTAKLRGGAAGGEPRSCRETRPDPVGRRA
jgi:hypothetical protein